jgi:hypothetical protein
MKKSLYSILTPDCHPEIRCRKEHAPPGEDHSDAKEDYFSEALALHVSAVSALVD